jgi:hypothetical protein
MAAIDRRSAIVSMHGVRFSGRFAWLLWLIVHITFLTGFKNRFTAFFHWLFSFVGTSRSERAIVADLNRLLACDQQGKSGRQGNEGSSRRQFTAEEHEISDAQSLHANELEARDG